MQRVPWVRLVVRWMAEMASTGKSRWGLGRIADRAVGLAVVGYGGGDDLEGVVRPGNFSHRLGVASRKVSTVFGSGKRQGIRGAVVHGTYGDVVRWGIRSEVWWREWRRSRFAALYFVLYLLQEGCPRLPETGPDDVACGIPPGFMGDECRRQRLSGRAAAAW